MSISSPLTTGDYLKMIKYYREHPIEFVRDINGFELTDQQKEVFNILPEALKEGKSIAVGSGHGIGKKLSQKLIFLFGY